MKPKVKKFRIRRADVASSLARQKPAEAKEEPKSAPEPAQQVSSKPSFSKAVAAGRASAETDEKKVPVPAEKGTDKGAAAKPAAKVPEAAEGEEALTGRQLRIARRVALRHGLEPESDLDAVRILRAKGIDPFSRESVLDLVSDKKKVNLPTRIETAKVPSTEVGTEADMAREVQKIQQDMARRRRRRVFLLTARLLAFVLLPTLLAGYYYFRMATPMYATYSEFVIQSADGQSPASGGGIGAMLAGAAGGGSDAITVQGYLTSRAAMARLDEDHGFKAHFSDPKLDFIQRLPEDATNEDAFKIYQDRIKLSFDPTEGVVKMEVVAASPETSLQYSEALIGYAEEQVDNLTQRLREDQMKGARESFADAEEKAKAAQRRVLELQETRGILSADLEVSAQMQQISTLEVQLNTDQLRLQELLQNPRPNPSRVAVLEGNIERLEALILDLRSELTDGMDGQASLARISGELIVAQAELETRQGMLSQSLQQMELARIEANRQVRYLSLGVPPFAPDEASYPRAFENTLLAFLVFAGIYLMVSLTAAVLREQVSG